jgi:hemolysin activation/secretion protein
MKFLTTGYVCLALSLGLVTRALAQDEIRSVDPSAVRRRQEQIEEYYERSQEEQLQSEQEKELIIEKQPVPEEELPSEQQAVLIERIEMNSSELLTLDDLRSIIDQYEGRKLTIHELKKMTGEINDLYRDKGYITARAILPPQKISDGIVDVRLIEGRIGDISLEGNASTRDTFILSRLPIQEGGFLNARELENALESFNSIYDISVKVELKPGQTFGTTDCVIRVQEPLRHRLTAFTDNAGREDIGLYRLGALAADNSVFGVRDRLTLGVIGAEGTVSGSIAYDFPVNKKGTRLGASYDWNQIEVISGPFETLQIDGDSSAVGAYVNHPFVGRADLKIAGFFRYDRKETSTKFSDVTLVETEVNSLGYGADMQRIDAQGLWYARAGFTNAFSETQDDDAFFRANADLSRYQIVNQDLAAIFRISGQLSANDILPSSEQFQIGGLSTVRGYDEGLLIGENGYFLSAELNFPLFNQGHQWRDKIKGAVFVDHGGIFPYKPEDSAATNENDFITGAGAGLIINISKRFSGRVVAAFPLDDPDDAGDNFKIHFYFQSILF